MVCSLVKNMIVLMNAMHTLFYCELLPLWHECTISTQLTRHKHEQLDVWRNCFMLNVPRLVSLKC